MLTLLAKLLQALNSENSTRQIAAAIVLAFAFGLSPLLSIQAFLILFLVLFIRVHLATFILFSGLFSGLGYLLSGLIIALGEALLTSAGLASLFTSLYQLELFKLAHWHHTYNLGSLALSIICAVPLYFAAKSLAEKYRTHIQAYFEKLSIVKALKATKVFRIYLQLSPQGS